MLVQAARCRQAVRAEERVRVREIEDDEGRRLLRIIRRGTGSVVTWRRAQMVLLSAQDMPVAKIAEITFTSADRVRNVIHNFNADGFDSLYPKHKDGRPRTFTLPERREIKKIAKSKPAEHGLPFSTWSLAKLADFLVAEGVVDAISHEGLRVLLREEDIFFQRIKTWKTSRDPNTPPRRPASNTSTPSPRARSCPRKASPKSCSAFTSSAHSTSSPTPDDSGPTRGGKHKDPDREPRPRRRATYTARTGSGTCSPPTTWATTSSTATSSRRRQGERCLMRH
jgi:transposase